MKRAFYNIFLLVILFVGFASCSDDDSIEGVALSVDSTEVNFTGYSASKIIIVDATRQWSAVPDVDWISVTPDQYPGNGQYFQTRVSVSVTDNNLETTRIGHINFTIDNEVMATLTVNQIKKDKSDEPVETSPITWANLQWQASTAIVCGNQFEAGCCVFENGLTNAVESTTGEGIFVQIGWSKNDSNPSGDDWQWADCWFNGDWGDNFYYQGRTATIDEAGTYYFTFRCQQDDGPWVYAGTDGLYDGVDNILGTFEVKESQVVTMDYKQLVIDWANLQWVSSTTVAAGGNLDAGSCIHIATLTDADEAAIEGDSHIIAQLGYGTSADPKDGSWTWYDCYWNGDWGNNWYYQCAAGPIDVAGSYKYAFRYQIIDGDYASEYFYTETADFTVQ